MCLTYSTAFSDSCSSYSCTIAYSTTVSMTNLMQVHQQLAHASCSAPTMVSPPVVVYGKIHQIIVASDRLRPGRPISSFDALRTDYHDLASAGDT
ncbi:hypothetical protein LIA77_08962 [Sarocladium implicatum]|nr:hypothetical protein LIA77_08962 [Sarocladium implicatum]